MAQQSAEKALKAVRYRREGSRIRGHLLSADSTSGQLHAVIQIDAAFKGFEADAGLLDQYYTATRYPDVLPGDTAPYQIYSENQGREALDKARRIITESERSINSAG